MPYVNIQVTPQGTAPGASATKSKQKAALIKGVSELLRDVMDKSPKSTFVVIQEINVDGWG